MNERIIETGAHLQAAFVAFMGTEDTPTPVKIAATDVTIDRDCLCGGSRAVKRAHWDGTVRVICITCGIEAGRETCGTIGG